ncbi:MAG TPA: biotin--[acetyl-CoA-carboxylase] ligase [Ferruginibacter sp.]|nr:biotin--[acetyl-CoA-carboxylase] ligase [Chitinophagaceae bacterium]HRI23022.1 biotin--[acetyl-CoA-carboxylase] ligase [Ferruginibacter sp.]
MPAAGFLQILESVDSTNNYAMQQLHAGLANHGMAWFSMSQTAGKGQRGKHWKTEPGKNIAMSLVLQPGRTGPIGQFHLSAAVALACFEFFSAHAGPETKIKWPNDLYWRDRKAGGILIENVFHGKTWKWAVVGTGININQTVFDASLPNPVSLKQITGKEFDAVALAHELCGLLMKHVSLLQEQGAAAVLEAYNRHLYKKDQPVMLVVNGEPIEVTIRGVSEEGKLITSGTAGREFDFGQVDWVIESPR